MRTLPLRVAFKVLALEMIVFASLSANPLFSQSLPAKAPPDICIPNVGTIKLSGRITLLTMVDPECNGPCLCVTEAVASLRGLLSQQNLHVPIQFVSVLTSLKPLSNAEVQSYAKRFADNDSWHFMQLPNNGSLVLAGQLSDLQTTGEPSFFMNSRVYLIDSTATVRCAMSCFSAEDRRRIVNYVSKIEAE